MKLIFSFVLYLSFVCSIAQTSNTAVVHEVGFGFTLNAPMGWKYDLNAGKELRLPVVFYPDSTRWKKAPIVMYANVAFLNDSNQRSLEDVLQHDFDQFERKSFGEKVNRTKVKTLKTFTQRRKAEVYEFIVTANNNYEMVAYIEEKDVVVMLVIGTRDPKLYEKHKATFDQLVLSYYWLGEN